MRKPEDENRGRPLMLPKEKEFKELYSKHTNAEIADMFNVTISAVQKAARRYDLKKTETGRPRICPDIETLKKICNELIDREVAELYGVYPETVACWRKKAGITKYNKNK